jgi:tetratricopeptide (TPR) repeat protein
MPQTPAETVASPATLEEWEVLDALNSLSEKSLVLMEVGSESPRFRLLETVRQYARDRLMESGEAAEIRERHADHFLTFAEGSVAGLTGPEQKRWLDLVEGDHGNLRAALDFYSGAEDGGQKGMRLSGAIWRFWWLRGHRTEGRARLEEALSHPKAGDRTAARARALNGLGNLLWEDLDSARKALEVSLQVRRELGDRPAVARSLNDLAVVIFMLGDFAAAKTLLEESLEYLREMGDARHEAICLSNMCNHAFEMGEYAEACALSERALARGREVGDPNAICIVLTNLGAVLIEQGRYDEARAGFMECLALRREIEDPLGFSVAHCDLCSVDLWENNLTSALAHAEEALSLCRKHEDWLGMGFVGVFLGLTLGELGEHAAARSHLDESVAIFRRLKDRYGLSFALSGRALAASAAGDLGSARTDIRESLQVRQQAGSPHLVVRNLEGLAAVEAEDGDASRAATLLGAAESLRERLGSRTPPVFRDRLENAKSISQKVLGAQTFHLVLAEGRVKTQEEAVMYALGENE